MAESRLNSPEFDNLQLTLDGMDEKPSLFEYDSALRNGAVICGIDEAGRGPLAGDVFTAAVIFDEGTVIEGVNDSKKLTEKSLPRRSASSFLMRFAPRRGLSVLREPPSRK